MLMKHSASINALLPMAKMALDKLPGGLVMGMVAVLVKVVPQSFMLHPFCGD